jgi:threonine dehydratase
MRELVDDIVLVSEDALKQSIVLLLEKAHTLTEGAGAASVAAAVQLKNGLQDQTVVCILSGGNLPLSTLQRILADVRPAVREACSGAAGVMAGPQMQGQVLGLTASSHG